MSCKDSKNLGIDSVEKQRFLVQALRQYSSLLSHVPDLEKDGLVWMINAYKADLVREVFL